MDRGMYLGSAGQFETALKMFIEAAAIDPYNPDPSYQQGFTYMKLGRYNEALAAYRITERLAPGWYHVAANLWLAEAAVTNRCPSSLINDMLVLEDLDSPSMKEALAMALLERHNDVGALYLSYAEAARDHETSPRAPEVIETILRNGIAKVNSSSVFLRLFPFNIHFK
jgi:tetratricopeptide (TPR) repeat protein